MTYEPVKYVIFDMDGLLLNSEHIFRDVLRKILTRYGKSYDNEITLKTLGMVPQESYATFIKEYKLPTTLSQFFEEIRTELLPALQYAEFLPGVERLVNHLKSNNIPIAIATSSGKETYEEKIKRHTSFFDKFHHIVLGSIDPDVKKGKPAPDIFLVCASRFPGNPAPRECLVFEDAPNGVQAAVSAGMQVVMVPDSLVPLEKRKLATKVLNSLLEFKPEEFGLPKFD
ncbi:pseudouridine-5'-phosphatase-like [Planococcus citri]|uniref:pseudouridine-5'-phosphatase-like n=1 Tax=Planococcus citri TaxID=170843 RepID=UPI0031F87F5E